MAQGEEVSVMQSDFILQLLKNTLVMSAAILLLYILSRLFQRVTSPGLRFICWLIVAVGLLLPVRPALYTVPLPESTVASLSVDEVFKQPAQLPVNYFSTEPPGAQPDVPITESQEITSAGKQADVLPAQSAADAPDSSAPSLSSRLRDTSALLFSRLQDNAAFLLWSLGVFVFLSACFIRHRRFVADIRRFSRTASDEKLCTLLEEVCQTVKLHRRPELLICSLVTSPAMTGLFRPVLILPDKDIEPEQLRLMLLHEVTHCKHGDLWFKALALLAMSANWFNPLVYLMNRCLITESELACDNAVLRFAGSSQRIVYGKTIISAARRGRDVSFMLASAFSGSGKSLKRRLRAIVERRNTRKWISVCCALVMLCSLLLTALASCGGSNKGITPVPQSKVDLTPTDELIIYLPSAPWVRDDLDVAISAYKQKYPEINLVVETVGESDNDGYSYNQYRERVSNELMSGAGPDVVIANPYVFDDLYKTMDTGVFLNLSSIFDEDENFVREDFNMAVLDAGVYKGGRYIVPYSYLLPILTALPDKLEAAGIDLSVNTGFAEFFEELDGCLSGLGEAPTFRRSIGLYEYFPYAVYDAGLMLIDYEHNKILPDEPAFRTFCETIKSYWVNEYAETYHDGSTRFEALSNDQSLFAYDRNDANSLFFAISQAKANDTDCVLSAVRSMDGGLTATMNNALAIRAGSPNQLNAWNFIKVMLDEKVQKGKYGIGPCLSLPVNTKSLNEIIACSYTTSMFGSFAYGTSEDGAIGTPVIRQIFLSMLIAEEKQPLLDICCKTTSCVIPVKAYDLSKIVPYFNDEKSLDECIDDLKSQLTFYTSE